MLLLPRLWLFLVFSMALTFRSLKSSLNEIHCGMIEDTMGERRQAVGDQIKLGHAGKTEERRG